MIRNRSNWFFPLCLAVVLGGVTFWLDKVTEVQTVEVALNPNEPKYTIDGIAGERFNRSGQRDQSIIAERAWQYPKQNEIHFSRPDLTLYDQGHALYRIRANEGLYRSDNKQIDLNQNVVWHKNSRPNEPEAELTTSQLTVDTQSQSVYTDAPISYLYGASHGTATGFVYHKQRGFLNLNSRIKAIIYDPKNP
ncbi:LPS export ABC transporter periplasmic protein LptC [Snodgrassella sp. CFCC 13594]|uniref:LPS export ABC transporter periplasmic protein LptC n=1 Tax=Snodgrassella sp. CFCC 13594 TaxID=1775559 RepID=UPI0008329B39|nr:LPS export ABC transporter periplasmic protein LptC [Snodgrassella sp. CFCC 13594]